MKRHRDATVTSKAHDASELARYIESFARASAGWKFPAKKSAEYEASCGKPSCCIVTASKTLPRAAIHLTAPKEDARSLAAVNIIPLAASYLCVDEYNAVLTSFAIDLRLHSRVDGVPIKVALSKADIRLSDIVTSNVARKLLRSYLALHPLSHHPLDIQRFDAFTCAVFRYMRKPFDLDAFQTLLAEELGWSAKNAAWCRQRVEVGLDVLAVNKRFNRR
jgi:hypothetical protein